MRKLETLRELQLITVYIYKDLLEKCKEVGVDVFLIGGTLLGAVRHEGYIPWDDDVDVCMSRTDYNKLLEATNGKISEKCTIIDPQLQQEYKGLIPTVVYNDSECVSLQFKEKENLKIGISIFIFDGVPQRKIARAFYFMRMYVLRAKHALCRADFKHVNTRAAKLVGPILAPFFKAKNVYKYKRKILKLQQKYPYENCDLICTNVDQGSNREVMKKRDFEKKVTLKFEGIESPTFSCYEEYLKSYYGDYMTPPTEAAQKPKHSVNATIEESFCFDE